MSSAGTRTRTLYESRPQGSTISLAAWNAADGVMSSPATKVTAVGKQMTASESHVRSRSDGSYREGGPFYTSLVRSFVKGPVVKNAYNQGLSRVYSGPIHGPPPTLSEMEKVSYGNIKEQFGDKNESQMLADGTDAISYSNPVNPASDLGTTLAESFREGVPSLPGIQSWERRTKYLKSLGSEYLNYIFGWAPLRDEVSSVAKVARQHRDLLKQYQRGEGSDTHRRFDFPSQFSTNSLPQTTGSGQWPNLPWEWGRPDGTRQIFRITKKKRWFEGVFTYGLPSSTDSWRKAMGFGSDADQLFGIALSPDILWELTPWSWAVDWFSNAGEVVNNVTNFGLAGLVMRYGYMMEETIDTVYAEGHLPTMVLISDHFVDQNGSNHFTKTEVSPGTYSCGTESVTKRRVPASPFGFSIGWEGLSPTQLAITAALGITRLP